MAHFIKKFSEININDISEVGGKNASLGEMFNALSDKGVIVPDGFATTASGFQTFLEENGLREKLRSCMERLDRTRFANLRAIGQEARQMILGADLSNKFAENIVAAYRELTLDGKRLSPFEAALRQRTCLKPVLQASTSLF